MKNLIAQETCLFKESIRIEVSLTKQFYKNYKEVMARSIIVIT